MWLLGSFAVLSLLYRADTSASQSPAVTEGSAEQAPISAAVAPNGAHTPPTGAEVLTKRAQAERAYAELSANGAPPSSAQLAAAHANGQPTASPPPAGAHERAVLPRSPPA